MKITTLQVITLKNFLIKKPLCYNDKEVEEGRQ